MGCCLIAFSRHGVQIGAVEDAVLLILEDEGADLVARAALRGCGREPRYRPRNWDSERDARLAGRNINQVDSPNTLVSSRNANLTLERLQDRLVRSLPLIVH